MHKLVSVTALAAVTIALAGCGGNSFQGSGSSSGGTGGTGTGGTGGTGTTTYRMGSGTGTGFTSGSIDLSSTSIAAGGTASMTINIVDKTGALYTGGAVSVVLNSGCVGTGLATITPTGTTTAGSSPGTVSTSSGTVTATYTAKGCSGSDTITASATVGGTSLSASGAVTVASAAIGSIQFESASPGEIGLKGTGLGETSTVIFKVVDATGGARPGATVKFSLDTTVGGLTLSPDTATSAADGTVQTVVSSGTVHTTVRVTAAIDSPALTTQSSALAVTTGIPSSSAFSIATGPALNPDGTKVPGTGAGCPNVETLNVDGIKIPITVRLADRYNNPAPAGTAVSFTTNGGHIDGSCVTSADANNKPDGTCSVNWVSANPRPDTSSVPPASGTGRVMVLATAIGEEFFNDANSNGFYDSGEAFADLGEPYRDDNQNGAYAVGEYFLDFNKNSTRDPGDGTFKGITCTATSCNTTTLAIGVSIPIVMSSGHGVITFGGVTGGFTGNFSGAGLSIARSASGTVNFNLKDANGNSMPAGTTVAVSAPSTVGTVTQTPNPYAVGCDAGTTGATVPFSFTAATAAGSGNLTILVTSPGQIATVLTVPVTIT
ncbi:MAG: hypothetical protein JSR66_07225 [Proteobacteria bacterium]|nr:hypothetical protein [Pseudomonadota bacterium]